MSLNRYNPRRDQNEKSIVAALEAAGCLVMRVSGAGAPDLLCARQGRLYGLEVKRPKGGLTAAQEARRALGWPIHVVRSVSEALEAVELSA